MADRWMSDLWAAAETFIMPKQGAHAKEQRTMKEYAISDLKIMEERLLTAIHGVKDDLKAEISVVHTEIQEARGDFKRELTELHQRVKSDIAELRSDTQKEVQKLREEVERL